MDEEEREKVFLQEQIIKARNESKRIKLKLSQASQDYDELYAEA